MKKSLIALAVMAAAGAASAQSSVTLFGIVDATIAYGRSNGSGADSRTQVTNSGYNSSRLGFRGTEDLGGGMSASFWLEGSLGNDDGTAGQRIPVTNGSNGLSTTTPALNAPNDGSGLVFNRRSTVSLAGTWGELRIGRDYTPSFWNLTIFDPFGTNGVGTTLTLAGPAGGMGVGAGANVVAPFGTRGVIVRASNDIGYFLPANLGGLYGQVNYWHGDDAPNAAVAAGGAQSDGSGAGLRLGFGSGPFNVAASWARTKFNTTATQGDYTTWNIGGQWDLGMAKLMGHFTRDERDSTTQIDGQGFLIGALVPVGAGEIRVSYSQYELDIGATEPRARQLAVGYVHNLSKRTAVYTTVAHLRNRDGSALTLNGATAGAGGRTNSTGLDLGIRHSF